MDASTQGSARREPLGPDDSVRAARAWWDADAAAYTAEHSEDLADDLVWGPEGLTEREARLLGPSIAGWRVLEAGCGAADGSRWLAGQGAHPIALDVSAGMLAQARVRGGLTPVPLLQASADRLPVASGTLDAIVSAHGAYAFVADLAAALAEAARVLRPGGLLVFSVTHPIRWSFPDDPGPDGLVAMLSYFDRRAYVERDAAGTPVYVEHHRTLGDTVEAIVGAGLAVDRLVEPEWPDDHTRTWGAWSPLRGAIIPGTAIWRCRRP